MVLGLSLIFSTLPGALNWVRLISIGLVLAGAVSATAGCASDQQSNEPESRSLSQRVLALSFGTSLATAKTELGISQEEFNIGDETTLSYLPWRLIFVNDALKEKRREQRPNGRRLTGKALSQRVVFGLELGSTVDLVEKALGNPDAIERVYREDLKPSLAFWYGPWELRFQAGRLIHRTSY